MRPSPITTTVLQPEARGWPRQHAAGSTRRGHGKLDQIQAHTITAVCWLGGAKR